MEWWKVILKTRCPLDCRYTSTQSQARLLKDIGRPVPDLDYDLALKGHEVARTMMAVEALYPGRLKSSLR